MKFIVYIAAILIIGGVFVKDIYAEKEIKVDELGFKTTNPIELGYVDWNRNFNNAVEIAKREKKPLLVLFQEVPGCSTASGFGREVLTHPLIIEAVENEFIPVAIYNNKDGHDKEILSSFNESSWNNPAVRVITPERKELAPRLNGNYSKLGLVKTMKTALQNSRADIPEYLEILEQELLAQDAAKETAVIAMNCFWTGEGKLGSINGVLSTEPGFMGGREVVRVEFNSKLISFEELLKTAKSNNIAAHVYTNNKNHKQIAEQIVGINSVSDLGNFSADSEPKY
ncbi:MAG: VPGUxxT family thioredoxin-like (seleno)protein, type 2, partial [Thermodesulfobacteriota bacterium]